MNRNRIGVWAVALGLSLMPTACIDKSAVGVDANCEGGQVFVDNTCMKLCSNSGTCASTEVCKNEVCTQAICGDGAKEGEEECDAAAQNGDSGPCTRACKENVCGDGLVYLGVEECDDGNDNDVDACNNKCEVIACTDPAVDDDEDGIPDSCDTCVDVDKDGNCAGADNCPRVANSDQLDDDLDGVGNLCDLCPGADDTQDTDGDGLPNGCEPMLVADLTLDTQVVPELKNPIAFDNALFGIARNGQLLQWWRIDKNGARPIEQAGLEYQIGRPFHTDGAAEVAVAMTSMGQRLFFWGQLDRNTRLYQTDGSEITLLGENFTFTSSIAAVGGKGGGVVFGAREPNGKSQLWFSDGTKLGTKVLLDQAVTEAVSIGAVAYLVTETDGLGRELSLAKTDGTTEGTKFFDVKVQNYDSEVRDGRFYFEIPGERPARYWVADESGPRQRVSGFPVVDPTVSSVRGISKVIGRVYDTTSYLLRIQDATGWTYDQLWTYNETTDSWLARTPADWPIRQAVLFDGRVVFTSANSIPGPVQLWVGTYDNFGMAMTGIWSSKSAMIDYMQLRAGALYFLDSDIDGGLWRLKDSNSAPVRISFAEQNVNLGWYPELVAANDRIYFPAADETSGIRNLWSVPIGETLAEPVLLTGKTGDSIIIGRSFSALNATTTCFIRSYRDRPGAVWCASDRVFQKSPFLAKTNLVVHGGVINFGTTIASSSGLMRYLVSLTAASESKVELGGIPLEIVPVGDALLVFENAGQRSSVLELVQNSMAFPLKDVDLPGRVYSNVTVHRKEGETLMVATTTDDYNDWITRALIRTDGTASGTSVTVLNSWPNRRGRDELQGIPSGSALLGDNLLFSAYNTNDNLEVSNYNIVDKKRTTVTGFTPSRTDTPQGYVSVFGRVYFTAVNGNSGGRTLYSTDGKTITAMPVNAEGTLTDPHSLTIFGDRLCFVASGNSGMELYCMRNDGIGPYLVKDINPQGNSSPAWLTAMGDLLYFSALSPENGRELFRTDGTMNGTAMEMDINSGLSSSDPSSLKVVGDNLWFMARDGTHGFEPWKLRRSVAD